MSSLTKLILYGIELSPPVRTVLLTLKALKLDYEFRVIDIPGGEQLKPEYLAKNPQHTVPALEDGQAMLWDSHAISSYLVRKYAKDDALYPKDFVQRAIVDQRLHFESGILFHTCMKQITKPLFYENAKQIPKDKIAQIQEAYAMLEQFLGDNQYMAGNTLTIADFSIVTTVSSLSLAMCAVDATKYPKLMAWLERMAALPYYEEVNMPGAIAFTERVRSFLPKQYDKLWLKAAANIKQSKDKQ